MPLVVLLLSVLALGLLEPRLFRASTLSRSLQQIAVVGILGYAQALVVLTAGIDLSLGAIAVFSSVIMGQLAFPLGLPPALAILLGLAAGAVMGAANGALIAFLRLPSFIVTLGSWQIILAANFTLSANETIRASDIAARAPALQFWGRLIEPGGVKVLHAVFLTLALVLLLAHALRQTAWGRHLYATGDDPVAAELSGVRTRRMLVKVYALAGLIAALPAG